MREIGIAQYQGKPQRSLPVLLQDAKVAVDGARRRDAAKKPIVTVGPDLNKTFVTGTATSQMPAAGQGEQRKQNSRLRTSNTEHG